MQRPFCRNFTAREKNPSARSSHIVTIKASSTIPLNPHANFILPRADMNLPIIDGHAHHLRLVKIAPDIILHALRGINSQRAVVAPFGENVRADLEQEAALVRVQFAEQCAVNALVLKATGNFLRLTAEPRIISKKILKSSSAS